MMEEHTLPWRDPAGVFLTLSRQSSGPLAFLYSTQPTSYSGRYSFLAWDGAACVPQENWLALEAMTRKLAPSGSGMPAFGYLSYEMLHQLENIPLCPLSPIFLPRLSFFLPKKMLRFDHEARSVVALGEGAASALDLSAAEAEVFVDVATLASNMNAATYLKHVEATRAAIAEGQFYQANLTRKFYGSFEGIPEAAALFLKLQDVSPAPYGAYMRLPDDTHILSSSPELFFRASPGGLLETRPIKGTLKREGYTDLEARALLLGSDKERAENLMIVDLMRNDLARVSKPASVDASRLFELDAFRTVYHLSSTVTAQLHAGTPYLEAVKAAFPPGSMTGAPKIAAMRWIAQREAMQRGVYSGALGWLAGDACELSVVIRTLLIQNERFEFQVGGGIVSDSEPEREWRETLAKARGIALALGISENELINL
jgi:para-aminobenzoate synthetase component 1